MSFHATAYQMAAAHYEETWRVMDNTLYGLCREHPTHTERSSVCAKLWLIGRTYATGIERKVKTTGSQGSSMAQITDHFIAHAGEIDSLLGELQECAGALSPPSLLKIAVVHGALGSLLCPITRGGQSTRSFASKYLHFHNPTVPIYDSVAFSMLRREVRWNKALEFAAPGGADLEYARFLARFYKLYCDIRQSGQEPTVRHVDHYLLTLAKSAYSGAASSDSRPA